MLFLKNQIGYILGTVSLFSGCISSTITSKSDTATTVVMKITKEGTLPAKEWHVYNFPSETICVPSKWRYIEQKDFLFVESIDQNDPNSYFQVVLEMKNEEGERAYLKRLYSTLKKGVSGTLDKCSAINTVYNDKTVLSSEFHLKTPNERYVIYSTIFEKKANLYEIRLEFPEKRKDEFKQIYYNILYNFYCDKKLVFNVTDKIQGAQIIEMNTPPE